MRPSFESAAAERLLPGAFLAAALLLAGCATSGQEPAPAGPVSPVTIMTFNVENLFDTEDDPGKNDQTYLPLAAKQNERHVAGCAAIDNDRWRDQCLYWNWSDSVVERKLALVARAILQTNEGRGPDIVALQEVENAAILERLRRDHLGTAGYREAILIEGADRRGIDVAFLSRLPLVGRAALHPIGFSGFDPARVDDTRGILQATFRLPDGRELTGFAVHFPAPYHPYQMREQAYEALNALAERLPEGRHAFAAGDFNTTSDEVRTRGMLERFVRDQWDIAHEFGCGDCPGTYYYAPEDNWSFLDMILWRKSASRSLDTTWKIDPASVRLVNGLPEQRTAAATPAGFELDGRAGVSDHWPLLVAIERR
ncbi:MAG: endonuclease/exonuclease/phosphatase family protein [Pseudomonadota bacterium]